METQPEWKRFFFFFFFKLAAVKWSHRLWKPCQALLKMGCLPIWGVMVQVLWAPKKQERSSTATPPIDLPGFRKWPLTWTFTSRTWPKYVAQFIVNLPCCSLPLGLCFHLVTCSYAVAFPFMCLCETIWATILSTSQNFLNSKTISRMRGQLVHWSNQTD